MSKYRIVRDSYCGYEVQIWHWWWPLWMQVDFCNTHRTIEQAREFAEEHARGCVEYLGEFVAKDPT